MLEFIKMFGLGVLYTILLPFIIAVFALYLVYVFFNYLVVEAKTFFGFFFGYTFTEETELEKKLEDMKKEKIRKDSEIEKQEISYEYQGNVEVQQEVDVAMEKGSDDQ